MSSSNIIRDKFLPWYKSHGINAKALGYGGNKSQEVRFIQFIRAFDLDKSSLLDVGCGFGDFYNYIKHHEISLTQYMGVDLLPEFVEASEENIKDDICSFKAMNFVEDPLSDNLVADYVIAVAALNTKVPNRDDFVKEFLTRMWALCRKGIGFDMESIHGFRDRDIDINLDPAYWLDYVMSNFSNKVILYSDYHDADFTICAFKDSELD